MAKVLDTNVLMSGKAEEGIVTYPVLKELDRLKTSSGLTGKQARDAIYKIHSHPNKFELCYQEQGEQTVDDFLIKFSKKTEYTLHTLDLSLKLKAEARNCKVYFPYNGHKEYTGTTYLSDADYAKACEGRYKQKHPINHFLIANDDAFIQTETGLERVGYRSFKTKHYGKIKPRNIEQQCLFELLFRGVPIVEGAGGYGVGKSFILLNYAISQLEAQNISKLVVIPNNSSVNYSMDLAALPGGIFEKTAPYTNVLLDMISTMRLEEFLYQDRIEVVPMAVLRGRNFDNSIVWVSEAQNLHDEHMKLIVGRIGEGTRLFVDCDPLQSDKRIFSARSGIKLLTRITETKFAKKFGMVTLKDIERSETAQLAYELSQLN